MQDNAREPQAPTLDPTLRAQLVAQMEKDVTVEICDRDYQNVHTPCLPMDGSIQHWK